MTWTARSAATPRLRRVLVAPCTRRAWAELGYAIVSFPVAIAGFLAAVDSGIADRLVVSERAVEKHVSNIFGKLGLPASDADHRRVLAVLAYLGS
jgi:hypothetical protein